MTEFQDRLSKAIERGRKMGNARARAEAEKALSERELRNLHTQHRLELSDHIETCLKSLPRQLPGFEFKSIVSERGWGAAVSRDDFRASAGRRRENYFSRLEMVIRPVSEYFVLELGAKGTIMNKEVFNRSHFQRLAEVDVASFHEMIDRWILEFAELYAAKAGKR